MVEPALSPITAFLRDIFICSYNTINNRTWLICGGGQTGVSTLINSLETDSDVIPAPGSTQDKVPARTIKAHAQIGTTPIKMRLKAADMMNQAEGRWQYLEEIVKKPVGVVYLFRTYNEHDGTIQPMPMLEHWDGEFYSNNGHGKQVYKEDYEQFEFLTTAMLHPELMEEKYPDVFRASGLQSDIRYRYMNKFKGWTPQVLLMVANFRDLTFDMVNKQNEFQAKMAEGPYLAKYKKIFEPLTDQWQTHQRKRWGKKYITIKYASISAKYGDGVGQLLAMMNNKTMLLGS